MEPRRLTPEQQRWVEQVTPRVLEIARAVRHRIGTLSLDDYLSAGNEALVRAALRYDPTTGVPFQAFAYLRVRGAMIDAVRAQHPAVRQQRRALRALEATQAVFQAAEQAAPDRAQSDPRTVRERVDAAADLIRQTTAAVLLARLEPADPELLPGDTAERADERLLAAESRALLARAIGRCDPEERALIEALYFGEHTMHTYAAELRVNVSTISRRHARLIRKLAAHLAPDPPPSQPGL